MDLGSLGAGHRGGLDAAHRGRLGTGRPIGGVGGDRDELGPVTALGRLHGVVAQLPPYVEQEPPAIEVPTRGAHQLERVAGREAPAVRRPGEHTAKRAGLFEAQLRHAPSRGRIAVAPRDLEVRERAGTVLRLHVQVDERVLEVVVAKLHGVARGRVPDAEIQHAVLSHEAPVGHERQALVPCDRRVRRRAVGEDDEVSAIEMLDEPGDALIGQDARNEREIALESLHALRALRQRARHTHGHIDRVLPEDFSCDFYSVLLEENPVVDRLGERADAGNDDQMQFVVALLRRGNRAVDAALAAVAESKSHLRPLAEERVEIEGG
jgi:hypothetical protein